MEESPTKSPHKSTGVTPKLESLSLSKNENRLKRLEECDLASLIEEELSRQQFLLDSLKSEESTKGMACRLETMFYRRFPRFGFNSTASECTRR